MNNNYPTWRNSSNREKIIMVTIVIVLLIFTVLESIINKFLGII